MKIAQVAPLYESVPPKLYGGTERVVSYLTEALVAEGHDVTLFASGDSQTTARLIACVSAIPAATSELCRPVGTSFHDAGSRGAASRRVRLHSFSRRLPALSDFADGRFTSSDDPARQVGPCRLSSTVPAIQRHAGGVDFAGAAEAAELGELDWQCVSRLANRGLVQGDGRGKYLAFLGRISPEKRVDRAIEIALASGDATEDRGED